MWPGIPNYQKQQVCKMLAIFQERVDFLHEDKDQSVLQVDTISCVGHGQSSPKYPK